QSVIFLLPIDILRILAKMAVKPKNAIIDRVSGFIVVSMISFFVLYVPILLFYDFNVVDVNKIELDIEDLHPDLKGFKIAFISDIQADWYTTTNKIANYLNEVNNLEPDLILIGGDLITSSPQYIQKSADLLKTLKSQFGVYSTVGDHDNWAYRDDNDRSRNEIKDALSKYAINFIDDHNIIIPVDSGKIGISFITDTYSKRISNEKLTDLTNSLSADFKIMLAHQPVQKIIDKASSKNYNLMLAGHTHGGQITFLFPFVYLGPTLIETNYVRGEFWFGDLLMYVNRGLGVSLAPIRYNSTPEVTLFILK
ncbi:MAG: metallophosphoesterase, partial [Melioribacteraceae bacterium]|nr:metallophosphoesterase [Melioribacteraceae bacterium]